MADIMSKMTKAQLRRGYVSLMSKASRLWVQAWKNGIEGGMTTADYITIEKICAKYQKKLK